MKGSSKDVQVDTNISYSLINESFNKPLRLTNKSDHTYTFKIKTNQKTVISLQTTHDFILPHSIREIAIRLADKPSETAQLKLEFNYAMSHEEDIANKDSKMTSYPKEEIFRVIVPVHKQETETSLISEKVELVSPGKDFAASFMSTPAKVEELRSPRSEVTQEISLKSGKVEAINVTEYIEIGKTTKVELQATSKIELIPQAQSPEIKPQEQIEFKKVESSEIKIEASTVKYPELDSSLYHSAKLDQSVSKPAPVRVSFKQTSEEQALISQLEEKIAKERSSIKTMEYQSTSNSVYPFSMIIGLLIVSFCMGSLFNHILL